MGHAHSTMLQTASRYGVYVSETCVYIREKGVCIRENSVCIRPSGREGRICINFEYTPYTPVFQARIRIYAYIPVHTCIMRAIYVHQAAIYTRQSRQAGKIYSSGGQNILIRRATYIHQTDNTYSSGGHYVFSNSTICTDQRCTMYVFSTHVICIHRRAL
jgi:hypothetical protein